MLEGIIEKVIFASRWMLAPLYLGLALALIPILFRFFDAFWHMITNLTDLTTGEVTLEVLELLDTVLLANLIIIVLFAGYENFVSKIKIAEGAEDRPHWMGHVDYSGLKIKLIGSLVAISVIELLKDFMQEGPFDAKREGWRIGIHMTFVVSGVLFALMDMMADRHKSQR
jgi:uncharacterized protein (TIGR00645 family)